MPGTPIFHEDRLRLVHEKLGVRDALIRARQVLNEAAVADTFLGRKHYELISLPEETERAPRWPGK